MAQETLRACLYHGSSMSWPAQLQASPAPVGMLQTWRDAREDTLMSLYAPDQVLRPHMRVTQSDKPGAASVVFF